jgi:hypothetical protein
MPELQRVLAALVFGRSTKVATYKALFSEGRWASLLELFLRELYRLHALLPESALTVHLQVRLCDRPIRKHHSYEHHVRVSDSGRVVNACAHIVAWWHRRVNTTFSSGTISDMVRAGGVSASSVPLASSVFLKKVTHAVSIKPCTVSAVQAGLIALKNPPSSSSSSREDPLQHPDLKALSASLPCAKHVHSKLICAVTREIMTDANPPMVLPNGYVYSQKAVDQIAAKNNGRIVCPHTGSEYGYDEARRAFIV